jgi:peptidyl-prolyl cis-trans isomerase SurA
VFRVRTFSIVLTVALLTAIAGALPPRAQAQDALRIAAVVNDEIITGLDLAVRTRMAILSSGLTDTPEVRSRVLPQVLRAMVDERLKLQEAKRQNITVSQGEVDDALARIAEQNHVSPADMDRWLQSGGMLLGPLVEQIRATISWNKLVSRRLGPTVSISEDEVDDSVRRMSESRGQTERRVSEIFLAVDNPTDADQVKQGAERLVEQIRGGADFSSVALQFSDSATAAVGGDIGWVMSGQLSSDLEQALAALRPGEIAGPIQTVGGYYILLLRDERTSDANADAPVLHLNQVVLPLPKDATSEQVALAQAAAEHIQKEAKTCDEFQSLGRTAGAIGKSDLGTVSQNDLSQQLRQLVTDLPVGQASAPQQIDGGLALVMVCSRDAAGNATQRQDVLRSLQHEKLDLLARRYLRDLRRAAFVDIRV